MRVVRVVVFAMAGLFVAVQLVPYGRDHTNPPVTRDAPWSSAEGRGIAVAACYDCHSNETRWPWYSHVAPMSWLVQDDVDEGRDELNFSEWDRGQDVDDLVESVVDASMPPRPYLLLHPSARLSEAEKAALLGALEALEAGDDGRGRG
ncbi:MAG TPA: heme-binding domain-containing protein [Acidimicrobiales bacterium]|nr:heme-binding domain-containing protein [Acidimicrobiales bacterium]